MVVGTNQLTTLHSKLIYGNFVCHGFTKKNDKYRLAVFVRDLVARKYVLTDHRA